MLMVSLHCTNEPFMHFIIESKYKSCSNSFVGIEVANDGSTDHLYAEEECHKINVIFQFICYYLLHYYYYYLISFVIANSNFSHLISQHKIYYISSFINQNPSEWSKSCG